MAEYFRGPRNSITIALHYGKCQWVFKIHPLSLSPIQHYVDKLLGKSWREQVQVLFSLLIEAHTVEAHGDMQQFACLAVST